MKENCYNCKRFEVLDGASVCKIGSRRYWMTMRPAVCGQYKPRKEKEHEAVEKGTGKEVGTD